MPELDEKLKHYAGAEDQALWRQQVKNEDYELDGELKYSRSQNLVIFHR